MTDFLDELASDQQFNENVDQGLLARIETLIWYSSMSDAEKHREMKRMLRLESIEDAMRMVKFLEDFQPVPPHDRAAVTQYEIVKATRERADYDDFKERKK
jgi:hypothetical protein